ncbi:MAG: 16S rRNA (cytosine(967)-C(5))-methyltransferase RsmB [Armatimonadetes bacterium]|nr:16S rRNA (cytosine(967)-C(5))-methyltransferase RsmB [Armatimonadota bacterium]
MIDSSRRVAVEVVARCEQGAFAERVLEQALARAKYPHWSTRATALAYGTLRLRARLDAVLGPFLSRPLAEVDAPLRAVLRVGAYELLFADHVETAQAVHALVELAKDESRGGHVGLGSLTNAVLRKLVANADQLRVEPPGLSIDQRLEGWWSLPRWVAERWVRRWGEEGALELAQAAGTDPHVHLRVNRCRTDREQLLARLTEAGVRARPSALSPWGVLISGGQPERLPGFAEGWFTVQDEASVAIAELTGAQPGLRAIDLCAAPGSKATQLAEMGAEVLACDIQRKRLARVDESALRMGLTIETLVADARELPGKVEPADIVLLDAPCSGTGTLARRPDLRWRLDDERLAEVQRLQRELLAAAARLVKPGGVLVYSTCSLEPEENDEQMTWLAQVGSELLPDGPADVTLKPVAGQHDGFFMARRRRAET